MITHLLGHDVSGMIFTCVNGLYDQLRMYSWYLRIYLGKE